MSTLFPKARLFVVDENSLKSVKETNIVSAKVPDLRKKKKGSRRKSLGSKWQQTVVDLAADMLQIEVGDFIFLWQTKNDGSEGESHRSRIFGVYRAISKPFFRMDSDKDEYPFKVCVELAYDFEKAVDEYDVMNSPLTKGAVWTIWGKKIAQKSRASTPLTMEGVQYLITLLMWKNEGQYKFTEWDPSREDELNPPLKLCVAYDGEQHSIDDSSRKSFWNQINPNTLPVLKKDGALIYEKVFEALFNQKIVERDENFFQQLNISVKKVIWNANYLPYSFEKNEFDYLLMESDDLHNVSKYILIEFMTSKIDVDHVRRCYLYSEWLNGTYGASKNVVRPILICSGYLSSTDKEVLKKKRASKQLECLELLEEFERRGGMSLLEVYTYSVKDAVFTFTKVR